MKQHQLAKLMAERIASGLKRKSLVTCSQWAERYRIMPQPNQTYGPWKFDRHPWLKEMHDSTAEMNVGQKASQVGFTETALNRTFFMIDVKGADCLYVLPTKTPDATDFSNSRFNPALELSPHLSTIFSDVQNIGHKRAGSTNLYVRGSRSKAGLKSIPVGFVVIDELEECNQENVPLALERMAGQTYFQSWLMSTPRIDNEGINKHYELSSKEQYHFQCPSCSRWTNLIFPECLEITADDVNDDDVYKSYLKCKECKCQLHHETKTEWLDWRICKWVAAFPQRAIRGFHVNQLYSMANAKTPPQIAKSYLLGLKDPAEEQTFWNSNMGLPHIPAGARVSDVDIENCKKDYRKLEIRHYAQPGVFVTMGVDVGRMLHVEIDAWTLDRTQKTIDINMQSRPRVLFEGKFPNFEDLDVLMMCFGVHSCVIDSQPDRRKSLEFAMKFYGRVKMCFYGVGISGKLIHVNKDDKTEPTITVDRTSWMDLSLGRFRNQGISLPFDVSMEYRNHIKAPVRIYQKNNNGQTIARYVEGSREDHFAHARNYAEIALPFAASIGTAQDIRGIV